jgi:hypothetical protein
MKLRYISTIRVWVLGFLNDLSARVYTPLFKAGSFQHRFGWFSAPIGTPPPSFSDLPLYRLLHRTAILSLCHLQSHAFTLVLLLKLLLKLSRIRSNSNANTSSFLPSFIPSHRRAHTRAHTVISARGGGRGPPFSVAGAGAA